MRELAGDGLAGVVGEEEAYWNCSGRCARSCRHVEHEAVLRVGEVEARRSPSRPAVSSLLARAGARRRPARADDGRGGTGRRARRRARCRRRAPVRRPLAAARGRAARRRSARGGLLGVEPAVTGPNCSSSRTLMTPPRPSRTTPAAARAARLHCPRAAAAVPRPPAPRRGRPARPAGRGPTSEPRRVRVEAAVGGEPEQPPGPRLTP